MNTMAANTWSSSSTDPARRARGGRRPVSRRAAISRGSEANVRGLNADQIDPRWSADHEAHHAPPLRFNPRSVGKELSVKQSLLRDATKARLPPCPTMVDSPVMGFCVPRPDGSAHRNLVHLVASGREPDRHFRHRPSMGPGLRLRPRFLRGRAPVRKPRDFAAPRSSPAVPSRWVDPLTTRHAAPVRDRGRRGRSRLRWHGF